MDIDKIIQGSLNRTGIGKIQPSSEIIDNALSFNVRDLDTVPETEITKMIVGVSQYIIYITLEINKFKIQKAALERDIDVDIATFVAKNNIVKGTKAEKRMLALGASSELADKDEKLNHILVELALLDNIDKYLEFYVNALKKELARRERELGFKAR